MNFQARSSRARCARPAHYLVHLLRASIASQCRASSGCTNCCAPTYHQIIAFCLFLPGRWVEGRWPDYPAAEKPCSSARTQTTG